jgi:hypothetical protein
VEEGGRCTSSSRPSKVKCCQATQVAQRLAARPLRRGRLAGVDEAFPLGLLPEAAALPRLGAGTPSEGRGDGAGTASCERGQEGS